MEYDVVNVRCVCVTRIALSLFHFGLVAREGRRFVVTLLALLNDRQCSWWCVDWCAMINNVIIFCLVVDYDVLANIRPDTATAVFCIEVRVIVVDARGLMIADWLE